MNPPTVPSEDNEFNLPPGKQSFSVRWIAKWLDISVWTVDRLIDEGSLKWSFNHAPKSSTKELRRVDRSALIDYLKSRKQ